MKRILSVSIALMLALLSLQPLQAYDFSVTGQVLETDQLVPVANHQVELIILQTGITETTLTAEDGTYSLTVMIPDSGSYNYVVQTYDYCMNALIATVGVPTPEGVTEDFVICANSGGTFDCEADFDWQLSNSNPNEVYFTDLSVFQPGSWFWNFGDGATSTESNPVHVYAGGGQYTVSLTISDADSICFDTYSEVIVLGDSLMNCQANFWWHHNSPNTNPLEMKFENNSYTNEPIVEFAWDFGDGNTSAEENPIHEYSTFGFYNVTLGIITQSGCSSSKTLQVWVNDPAQNCMAMFVPVIDSINPLQVYFFDLSVGEIDEWLYDFGDGATSTQQNPVHLYSQAAVYMATLTIVAGNCTSSFYYEIDLINGQVIVSPGGTTGIAASAEIEISLYPNPAENTLYISTYNSESFSVKITNLAGQTLIVSGENIIDVSQLPQGIYFATININGKIHNSKFIKK